MPPRRILAPILLAALALPILVGLGLWQVQRLGWKEGLIDDLRARLAEDPVAVPAVPTKSAHEFLRVQATGRFEGGTGAHGFTDAPLLTSLRPHGPGYRVIQPFTLEGGRRIFVDRGYVPVSAKNAGGVAAAPTPAPDGTIGITGALRFPEERADPPFGARDNVWVARDLERMATLFEAEPILLVAETSTAPGGAIWPMPQPLTVNLRNNHLEYALTWFALAAVWAAMSALWLRKALRTRSL